MLSGGFVGIVVLLGWGVVALAAARLLYMWREESREDRILGLLYHRVVPRELYDTFTGTEQIFSMPEDRFEEQLAWLRDSGHQFVSLDELADALHSGASLPDRAVCITFDDGCESVATRARPILERLGIPAAVFVTIDEKAWIFHEGEYFEPRMSIEQIRACERSGIDIGSHAVSHRGLNEMSRDDVLRELRESRETLSEWIERPVVHFAVPLNFYNRATLELCKEAGYRSVCTSDNGTSHPGTSPYKIKRFIVEGSHDLEAFERSLVPHVIVQRRILNAMKKLPPKLLGEKLWMPLRERIFESALGRWLTFRYLRRALLALMAAAGFALAAATIVALQTAGG